MQASRFFVGTAQLGQLQSCKTDTIVYTVISSTSKHTLIHIIETVYNGYIYTPLGQQLNY